MDPPPQDTEYGTYQAHDINVEELSPYIIPERITPARYQALLLVSDHLLREFVEAKINKRPSDRAAHISNLVWSRVLWEIVQIFSESGNTLISSC